MASLDKLTIRGFKSIRALEDFELKSLNLFKPCPSNTPSGKSEMSPRR